MTYANQERKKRLQIIKKDIEENQPRKKEKVIAETKIEFGLSESKAHEYIEDLKKADKIQENNENQLMIKK